MVNELDEVEIRTNGPGLTDFTHQAAGFLRGTGMGRGLLTLHVRHTSASLLIQENADPDVQADLQGFFERIAPTLRDPSMNWITHRTEGPDDMPAHIRAALTATTLSVPVEGNRMVLGTWQGIYLFEHRERPHRRRVALHAIGN